MSQTAWIGQTRSGSRNAERALREGRSLGSLSLLLIILLSVGLGIALYGELWPGGPLENFLRAPKELLIGFGFLMMLTVSYLASKQWSTGRDQRQMIEQLLDEESVSRALRLNPITQFHHPDVCRDLLLLQASHAARLHSPLSVLELHVANLEDLEQVENGSLIPELIRELRGLGRATDSVLRWGPDSFLLVFPELTAEELTAAGERMRREVAEWMEQRLQGAMEPALRWRGFSEENLASKGDILVETQRLLEEHGRQANRKEESASARLRAEKSVAMHVPLEIRGLDRDGKPFREKILTERIAADRMWFSWSKDLPEQTLLTVIGAERGLEENAVLSRWTGQAPARIAEVRFARVPDRWVLRADT